MNKLSMEVMKKKDNIKSLERQLKIAKMCKE